MQADPIDAVVTWVDGEDSVHRTIREEYMDRHAGVLCENARNPHRWGTGDEIYFCLASIEAHAPWLRYIWLIVDGGGPDPSRLPPGVRARLRVVRHHEIFAGYEHMLPTFNSLAIESVMWRIEGLANRFLYFNDDVFLTSPLVPSDVFDGDAPVLRGKWRDYSGLSDPARQAEPARFNQVMHTNAARLLAHEPDQIFAAAHVVHPLKRAILARLFVEHRAAFLANMGHRFRDLGQFLPQALHNHYLIERGDIRFATVRDYLHIKSGERVKKARKRLSPEALEGAKFLCVNDLPQLEATLPDARARIARAIRHSSAPAEREPFDRVEEPFRIFTN